MSFIGDFIGDVVGGITGTKQAAKAAEKAGETQAQAAERAIEEQRRQFERTLEILQPFVSAGAEALPGVSPYRELGIEQIGALREFAAVGPEALRQQRALAGLAGPEAQRAAISQIEGDPAFQALARQGEEAILQRASATGGLRGGNVQAALGQFRPALLNQFIEQQYGRLGGLAGVGGTTAGSLFGTGLESTELVARLGQASAAGQAAGATTLGTNVANLLQNAAAARAGGIVAGGNVPRQTFGDILQIGKTAAGFF